jgi:hypothetical protein
LLKGLLRYDPLGGLRYSSEKGCFTWLIFALHRVLVTLAHRVALGRLIFLLTDIQGVENERPQNIPLVLEAAALTLRISRAGLRLEPSRSIRASTGKLESRQSLFSGLSYG